MKRWAKKDRWKMFLYTGSVDDDVAASTSDINRIVETLQASPREIPWSVIGDERDFCSCFSIPTSGGPQMI